MKVNRYLELLSGQLKAMELPLPTPEYRFHPTRKWRFDFAWVEQKLALEVEGGIFVQGGHTRGAGYWNNLGKYNEATLLGWRVLRVVPIMMEYESGEAAFLVERALKPAS